MYLPPFIFKLTTITDIQILREGRKVSKQEYTQARAEFEQVYADADDATKRKLDALMQSA